jgi:hypothetical protein
MDEAAATLCRIAEVGRLLIGLGFGCTGRGWSAETTVLITTTPNDCRKTGVGASFTRSSATRHEEQPNCASAAIPVGTQRLRVTVSTSGFFFTEDRGSNPSPYCAEASRKPLPRPLTRPRQRGSKSSERAGPKWKQGEYVDAGRLGSQSRALASRRTCQIGFSRQIQQTPQRFAGSLPSRASGSFNPHLCACLLGYREHCRCRQGPRKRR